MKFPKYELWSYDEDGRTHYVNRMGMRVDKLRIEDLNDWAELHDEGRTFYALRVISWSRPAIWPWSKYELWYMEHDTGNRVYERRLDPFLGHDYVDYLNDTEAMLRDITYYAKKVKKWTKP